MAGEFKKLFVVLGMDDSEFGKKLDKVQKNLSQAGKMMTGMGVAITAALGLATKAAEEERINIARLSSVLDNVGVSYDEVSESLERNITAMQNKTGVADDRQRDALSDLIFATGDYQKALELLPTALDLAAAKGMDLGTAAELLGKVAQGEFGTLSRYGIILGDNATAAEALAVVQEKVAGAAEKMASPIDILKASFGDLVEKIGSNLLPVLKKIVDVVMPVIKRIMEWIDKNPKLASTITIIVAAIGALMAVLGPLLLMLPMIAAGFTLLMGPVGLVILAVAAVAAGAALIIMNWDKIKAWFGNLWEGIKKIFWNVVDWMKEWGVLFLGPVGFIIKYWDKIVDFFKGIPEKIGNAFSAVKDFILAPFRAAWAGIEAGINWMIRMLNKIQFDVPDWVPLIGGKKFGFNISEVNLPSFEGWDGVVPGPAGKPYLAVVHGGETMIQQPGGAGKSIVNNFNISGLTVREEADVRKVARELYRMQQTRV
jgi:phage-related protein